MEELEQGSATFEQLQAKFNRALYLGWLAASDPAPAVMSCCLPPGAVRSSATKCCQPTSLVHRWCTSSVIECHQITAAILAL